MEFMHVDDAWDETEVAFEESGIDVVRCGFEEDEDGGVYDAEGG
jgi:hypothetical protein